MEERRGQRGRRKKDGREMRGEDRGRQRTEESGNKKKGT